MKKLVIIDGHSILYRAYHALPKLTSTNGKPANAVYGFASMMLKVISDMQPDYFAVVFDLPGGTFRNELYDQYQAHRPKADDDLIVQISAVHNMLAVMDVSVFEKKGFEADDVIGTLVEKVKGQGSKVKSIVVTSDRDQLQLVSDNVQLSMPAGGGLSKSRLFGRDETIERMGVPPEQIIDFKALAGDPSDNIPGVAGVGPKTAISLLEQFGNLDGIYKNLEQVQKNSVRSKLEKHRDLAFLSQKLATIVLDVEVEFSLKNCTTPDLVQPQSVEFFHNLGFKSLVKRLTTASKNLPAKKSKNTKEPVVKKIETKKKKQKEQLGLF